MQELLGKCIQVYISEGSSEYYITGWVHKMENHLLFLNKCQITGKKGTQYPQAIPDQVINTLSSQFVRIAG